MATIVPVDERHSHKNESESSVAGRKIESTEIASIKCDESSVISKGEGDDSMVGGDGGGGSEGAPSHKKDCIVDDTQIETARKTMNRMVVFVDEVLDGVPVHNLTISSKLHYCPENTFLYGEAEEEFPITEESVCCVMQ